MDTAQRIKDTGEPRAQKCACVVRRRAGGKGQVGFDFLGFTIRQFPAGKTHTGKGSTGKALGFQTLIMPSKEAIKRHTLTIKERLRTFRSAS